MAGQGGSPVGPGAGARGQAWYSDFGLDIPCRAPWHLVRTDWAALVVSTGKGWRALIRERRKREVVSKVT